MFPPTTTGYGPYEREKPDTIEYSESGGEDLFFQSLGLSGADLAGLEGWGFIKKVGNFIAKPFKVVGKAVKKVVKKIKVKKLLAVAIPFAAGAFLGPLVGASAAGLIKKFGPKVAGLVKAKKVYPALVKTVSGVSKIALVSADEKKRLLAALKGKTGQAISEAVLKQLTGGQGLSQREIPGATLQNGKVNVPVYNSGAEFYGSTVAPADLELPEGGGSGFDMSKLLLPASILAAVFFLKKK